MIKSDAWADDESSKAQHPGISLSRISEKLITRKRFQNNKISQQVDLGIDINLTDISETKACRSCDLDALAEYLYLFRAVIGKVRPSTSTANAKMNLWNEF